MTFWIYWLAVASVMALLTLFTFAPRGPDGEGLIQRAFIWLFATFGTAPRDIRKFVVDVDSLYLRRFYLTPRFLGRFLERLPWWKWPTKIFLHHILRSDDDREPHTHPWKFLSLILWGSYRERILNHWRRVADRPYEPIYYTRVATPGTLLNNSAEHTHRVEIIRPVWSLVFVHGAEQEWGFWTQDEATPERLPRWVPWRTYLGIPEERDSAEDVIHRARPTVIKAHPMIDVDDRGIGHIGRSSPALQYARRPGNPAPVVGLLKSDLGESDDITRLAPTSYAAPRSEEITKRTSMAEVIERHRAVEIAKRIATAVERKGE